MAQLILTRGSNFHRALRVRNNAFPLTLRVGKFFLFFALTFIIGLLSFFYLVRSTAIHTQGFQLRRLELDKDRFLTEREGKNAEIAKLKSLNGIRESAVVSGMIPMRNPIFIKKDPAFALRATAGKP